MEGIRRSKLVFAGGHEGPEAVPIKDLKRVREPVSRSKSGVQGKVADIFHGCSRHAESQNEIKAFRILAATARADAWQEQPFILEYHLEGKRHRYTPDVLVVWGSHQEVIEIKEDLEAELPENRDRFDVVGDILAEYGYRFRLWKKSEICAEPRLANATLILRYRRVEVAPMERTYPSDVFFQSRPIVACLPGNPAHCPAPKYPSTRAGRDLIYRLVAAPHTRFPSEHCANWSPGMALSSAW